MIFPLYFRIFPLFLRFSLLLLKDKSKQQQLTAKMGNFTPTPSAPTPVQKFPRQSCVVHPLICQLPKRVTTIKISGSHGTVTLLAPKTCTKGQADLPVSIPSKSAPSREGKRGGTRYLQRCQRLDNQNVQVVRILCWILCRILRGVFPLADRNCQEVCTLSVRFTLGIAKDKRVTALGGCRLAKRNLSNWDGLMLGEHSAKACQAVHNKMHARAAHNSELACDDLVQPGGFFCYQRILLGKCEQVLFENVTKPCETKTGWVFTKKKKNNSLRNCHKYSHCLRAHLFIWVCRSGNALPPLNHLGVASNAALSSMWLGLRFQSTRQEYQKIQNQPHIHSVGFVAQTSVSLSPAALLCFC